ncbi:MAG TPA: ABC transporter ATP-binding protein [Actinomycetes bacterium]|jgi:peptide/nickel transport system ATP-binding protein/oligopeptide transport system ATP-binding protein|nr:ABC transporter ATP-binding protein [Actinomycetes bacterium]
MSAAARPPQPPAPEPEPAFDALLEVEDLKTVFHTEAGTVYAVDGVGFDVRPREVLAIVGESGCGKSVTALSIMGLIPTPAGQIVSGSIRYRGRDLLRLHREERRAIRGDRIAMVFQDPLTALNPVHRVGAQIAELILAHRDVSRKEARQRAVELLRLVGIAGAEDRARQYPHHFSGGMRQRVMIAMAIALDPDLLIADEPTTALDVTVQAQILRVLLDVRERFGMAIVLITHDLGMVAGIADRVVVMYAGKKVEEADVDTLYGNPKHPYTWGLLGSTTRVDRPRLERLTQIPGAPPSLLRPPPACRFAPRCAYLQPVCRSQYPQLRQATVPDHVAACHFANLEGWEPGPPAKEVASRLREAVS